MNQAIRAPIRVILADDHPVVRMGLATLMEDSEFAVVGEASGPGELLASLEHTECDVLVTDYLMPGEATPDGLRLVTQLRTLRPELPIVVLTMMRDPSLLRALWATGVRALVDKTTAMQDIVPALRLVAAGHTFLSADFGMRVAESAGYAQPLSGREADVMRRFASGMSVSAIAERQSLSVKTISKQKMDAMRKLGLRSDLELYRYAIEVGF